MNCTPLTLKPFNFKRFDECFNFSKSHAHILKAMFLLQIDNFSTTQIQLIGAKLKYFAFTPSKHLK